MHPTSDPTVYTLADQLVSDWAALRPIHATFMGVRGHDGRWGDLSPAGHAAAEAALRGWSARFDALAPPRDRWEALAQHVCRDWLSQELDTLAHRDPEVDLNSLSSTLQLITMVFDAMDTTSAAGWADVVARVEALPRAMAAYRECLEAGRVAGRAVARRQVQAAMAQARIHAGPEGALATLPGRLAAALPDEAALTAALAAALPAAFATFATFADWLEAAYLPSATDTDGVGRVRYLREMRRYLGATPDPEEAYRWGWEEMARIDARMEALVAAHWPGQSRAAVTHTLTHDAAHGFATREAFLDAMRARQAAAFAALGDTHFDIPAPLRQLDVRAAPGAGQLGAFYTPPSEDLSRPGAVSYLLPEAGPYEHWREVSTAYHEGFPGHHLQCGLQVALTDRLCRLHRVAYGYSGYAEGWALYAEELMGELGFYDAPAYELGMLANQLIRACRVVYDIGAHLDLPIPADAPFHPGARWTFALGVELLERYGGLSAERADREITRYLGFPAQAISYKLGQRVMLDLRREFLSGGHGTLRAFHARVLGLGNVGLDRLRVQVFAVE